MNSPISHEEAFAIANRFLGEGDEGKGTLWFIGLEQSQPWTREMLQSYRSRQDSIEPPSLTASDRIHRSPVTDYCAKIAYRLSGAFAEANWQKFRDERLGRPGSGILNLNFCPLGRSSRDSDPPDLLDLFGFDSGEKYEIALTGSDRLARINSLWKSQPPQAVVCFGNEGWLFARRAFDLEDMPSTDLDGGIIKVYPDARVILTPFFGRGMSDYRADLVFQELKKWGVSLP